MSASGRVVAVGHVGINARDLARLTAFYRDELGLRLGVHHAGVVSIFEVGETDLFLMPGDPKPVEFDLAADDVDALRERLMSKGITCDEARDDTRSGHRSFAFTDPEGNRVRVTSAHPRARVNA